MDANATTPETTEPAPPRYTVCPYPDCGEITRAPANLGTEATQVRCRWCGRKHWTVIGETIL